MATKYFLKDVNNDEVCDIGGAADKDLSKTQGSTTTIVTKDTSSETFVVLLVLDLDVSGDSPATGNHEVSIDITAITDLEVRWRVQEVDSGCTVQNNSSYSATYSTTGIKTDTLNLTWSTGNRLRLSIEGRKTGSHGNKNATIRVNDANSFVNAPWTASAPSDPDTILMLPL